MAGESRPERPPVKHKLEIFIIVIFGIFIAFNVLISKPEPQDISADLSVKKILITRESNIIDYPTGQDAVMLEYFVDGMPAHYIVPKSEFNNIPRFMDYLESLGSVVNLLPESKK